MTKLTIRVDLGHDAAFGPGKARLLEMIEQAGSIRSASDMMGMSYRRAWLLLKDIQEIFGVPVIATATGGKNGGGTALTEAGREIVDCYRTIESSASRAAAPQLRALSNISARSKAKKRKPPSNRRKGQ